MNVSLSRIEGYANVEIFIEEELLTLLYQGRYIKEIFCFSKLEIFFRLQRSCNTDKFKSIILYRWNLTEVLI